MGEGALGIINMGSPKTPLTESPLPREVFLFSFINLESCIAMQFIVGLCLKLDMNGQKEQQRHIVCINELL